VIQFLFAAVAAVVAALAFGLGAAVYARRVEAFQDRIDADPGVDRGDRPAFQGMQPAAWQMQHGDDTTDGAP
jgi:hypothetical protein